jgi:hypothetical protein
MSSSTPADAIQYPPHAWLRAPKPHGCRTVYPWSSKPRALETAMMSVTNRTNARDCPCLQQQQGQGQKGSLRAGLVTIRPGVISGC